MIRRLFRFVGAVLLLAGLALLAGDLLALLRGDGFHPQALGQMWYAVDHNSLEQFQAGIQRHVIAALWDVAIVPVLRQPAFLVALVLGLFLWLVTKPRRRTYYRGLR